MNLNSWHTDPSSGLWLANYQSHRLEEEDCNKTGREWVSGIGLAVCDEEMEELGSGDTLKA